MAVSISKNAMYSLINCIAPPGSYIRDELIRLYRKYFKSYKGIGIRQFPDNKERLVATDLFLAIHLHLFYIDLAEEFQRYFFKITVSYDLYVSVPEETSFLEKKRLEVLFAHGKANKVYIECVKNHGRDFGPMFLTFRQQLSNYKYVFHCHSKKSLWSGTENIRWRRYMMSSFLCDRKRFDLVLGLMEENPNIGMVYPDPPDSFPYWGHAALKNAYDINKLLNICGVDERKEYYDFSAGSFFIIKVSALKQLFDYAFKASDFETEEGQRDGTLAHAFERVLPFVAEKNGFDYVILKGESKYYLTNYCKKNIDQYITKSLETIEVKARKYDVVTVELFDTLITSIYSSELLVQLIGAFADTMGIPQFADYRKKYELDLLNTNGQKYVFSIFDLYELIGDALGISKKNIEKIIMEELALIIRSTRVRSQTVNLIKKLYDKGAKIILVTETYIPEKYLIDLMSKNGISTDVFSKIIVSCDVKHSKVDGSLWNYVYSDIPDEEQIVNIGANENRDIQIPIDDFRKDVIHALSPDAMCENSVFSYYCNFNKVLVCAHRPLFNLIEEYLIKTHLFIEPWDRLGSEIVVSLRNGKELGYIVLGPLMVRLLHTHGYEQMCEICNKNNSLMLLKVLNSMKEEQRKTFNRHESSGKDAASGICLEVLNAMIKYDEIDESCSTSIEEYVNDYYILTGSIEISNIAITEGFLDILIKYYIYSNDSELMRFLR